MLNRPGAGGFKFPPALRTAVLVGDERRNNGLEGGEQEEGRGIISQSTLATATSPAEIREHTVSNRTRGSASSSAPTSRLVSTTSISAATTTGISTSKRKGLMKVIRRGFGGTSSFSK